MADSTNTTECIHCGVKLTDNYSTHCPECRLNKLADTVVNVILIVSVPFGYLIAGGIGVIVGFALELVTFLLGPNAILKVIKILKRI